MGRDDQFDVVISGGGPVALASALEAIKLGKSVAMISDREIELKSEDQKTVFSRGQRIFLDEQSRNQLLKLFPSHFKNNPDDAKFFEHLTNDITIKVRDIERFLFRRIDEMRQNDPKIIQFINNSEVKTIDLEKGEVTIGGSKKVANSTEQRTLSFKYMIGADGVRHHAVNILNQGLLVKNQIQYKKIPAPKHPYHASVIVQIKLKDGSHIQLPPNQFIEVATKNKDGKKYVSGISLNRKGKDGRTVKCVFGGEVSKELFDKIQYHNKNSDIQAKANIKKEVTDYIAKVVANELGVDAEELDIQFSQAKQSENSTYNQYQNSKAGLSLQAFETSLMKANKAVYEANGHQFILAGDTYRIPNYQFGHGLNHSFQHAKFIGSMLEGKMNAKEYNQRCDHLSKAIEIANSFLNKLGQYGTKILLREGNKRPDRVRKQFSHFKNPYAIEVAAPIYQYLNTKALLCGHKTTAKRLLTAIKNSEQRPWDMMNCIGLELYKVKNRSSRFDIRALQYIKSLENAYKLAENNFICENNLNALQCNEPLQLQIKNLSQYMERSGYPDYARLAHAISTQDYKLVNDHALMSYNRRKIGSRYQQESTEGMQMRLLTEILVNNTEGKCRNPQEFVKNVEQIIHTLQFCKLFKEQNSIIEDKVQVTRRLQ
jgi:hypothetical protein